MNHSYKEQPVTSYYIIHFGKDDLIIPDEKEKLLEEYSSSGESQKQEISEIKNLNKRLEQALAKKEKQYTKVQEKLSTFEQIQAQIFSLSKTVQSKDDDE